MIDIETEYSELSLFLQEHNVLVPEKDLDTYEMIESVFERNNPSTAFYIINLGEIIRQYKLWRELFPYIEPRYAVKCNPNKVICQLLSILGVGFDVASKNEINLVKDYVNDMDKVIYANPYKESSSIQYARSIDVDSSVFDSEDELYKIKTYHPKCKLLMRIKVDDKNSLCKFSEKFGVDINDEAEQLLTLAKYMNLNVVGVSFHVGSGCMDATQYYRALEQCKTVFDIGAKIGYNLNMIDIGGGFPGFHDDKSMELLRNISAQVQLGFEDFFSDFYIPDAPFDTDDSKPVLHLISEPGRFFVQSSHTLLVNVIGRKIKNIKTENGEIIRKFHYNMNDGIYGSFNCIVFDHQTPELLPYNERNGDKYDSVVYGPTCDSIDKICMSVKLPELAIGEWCFIKNFGAYTVAAASDFNGFSKLKAFYILN